MAALAAGRYRMPRVMIKPRNADKADMAEQLLAPIGGGIGDP
jgi:hypothetical protein